MPLLERRDIGGFRVPAGDHDQGVQDKKGRAVGVGFDVDVEDDHVRVTYSQTRDGEVFGRIWTYALDLDEELIAAEFEERAAKVRVRILQGKSDSDGEARSSDPSAKPSREAKSTKSDAGEGLPGWVAVLIIAIAAGLYWLVSRVFAFIGI